MPSPYPNALKTPESELARLTRENETLRGIAARVMPCHYCGAAGLALCPHGFPGCALADDLMGFDACANRELREARAERDRLRAGVEARVHAFLTLSSDRGHKERGAAYRNAAHSLRALLEPKT